MNTAYRVWDGEQMHYWDDEGMSLTIEGENWYLYRKDTEFITSNKTAHTALMWGTGLKDKNGKVIYDKDIDITDDEPMIVTYKGGRFVLEFPNNHAYFDDCIAWEECDIGGNVYENRVLLEGVE